MGKKNLKKNNSGGFTLLEMVIAITIFSTLMFVVSSLLLSIIKNPEAELSAMSTIDHARMVSTNFTNELRGASFGSDGAYPLGQAGDSQIIFYSNIGASGNNINRIRYYILGNTLYKGVTTPSVGPLIYDPASESVKPILNGVMNGAVPVFYYYNGDYDGAGTELSQPINVNQAKFARINLSVKEQSSSDNNSIFDLNAGVAIRSLKDNLSD